MHCPLKQTGQVLRAKKVVRDICSKCDAPMMAGTKDPCWTCPWRWLQNEIIKSDLNNEKET